MDFDSPEVEKDFPGLTKKSKEESDYSDGEGSKKDPKKRKDKKDKGKDRGYAALEGESSPEEELDAKSPSKSKKSKTFKFTSSKSKEKREKSRDKDKIDKDCKDDEKLREKDKSEKKKDKKDKSEKKEKDKKDKKLKHAASAAASEDHLELGDLQPVFGVSVSLATERSRCHDGVDMPLLVRDCIDYLQEHGLRSEHIYKVEPVKTRLQQFKSLYNNRERYSETDELDVPTACGLLKLFLRELPEPILTTDLIARFEEVASHPDVTKQQEELEKLLEQLPSCNRILLSWILLHFDAVIQNEKCNKMNAQSLAMLLSPPLNMSHRLLVTLLCHCPNLFADVRLTKYVPPITPTSPNLPESPEDIQLELRKQESLIAQIHAEMNAGFVSKKREEQLWEVQRLITQLKRKLRSFEKKQEKSMEEPQVQAPTTTDTTDSAKQPNSATVVASLNNNNNSTLNQPVVGGKQTKLSCSDDESIKTSVSLPSSEFAITPQHLAISGEQQQICKDFDNAPLQQCHVLHPDGLYIDEITGFLMVPKSHSDYATLIRLQLENRELLAWKSQLQTRISTERAEILRLKQLQQQHQHSNGVNGQKQFAAAAPPPADNGNFDGDYGKVIEQYMRENELLEQKKNMLAKQIFEERRELVALQVEVNMQQF